MQARVPAAVETRAASGTPAWMWLAATVAAVAVFHVPFALFGRPFQDGWLHELLYERGAHAAIYERLLVNGRPVAGWLNLHAMLATGSGRGAIWLSVLSVVAAGAAWFMVFVRSRSAAPPLAFALACIAATSPANQIIVSSPTVIFVSAHAFFALGLWLFLEAHLDGPQVLRVAAYVGACVLGVLSALLGESTAPLLLVYPFVTLLPGLAEGAYGLRTALQLALRRSVPAVLGIAAFTAMFLAFPPVGADFATERRMTANPLLLALSAGTFAVTVALVYLPLWGVLVLAGRWREVRWRQWARGRPACLLGLAVASAVLTLGPYIVALRLASPTGWGLRYLYYFGPAMAWLVASAAAAGGGGSMPARWPARWAAWACIAVGAGLLVRWPLLAVRTVHEDVIAAAAAASPAVQRADVVIVDDKSPVMAGPLRDWEWSGLLQRALGRPGRVAGIAAPPAPESPLERFRLALRVTMGWAAPGVPALSGSYVREHVRSLDVPEFVSLPGQACRVAEMEVEDWGPAWAAEAGSWYVRSAWDSAGYRDWLARAAASRVRVAELPDVTPCR